ncbi:MAG: beta-galactosidase [Clostridia bacterium]|nr:beta-galactosidase [Clostridia bacterium]
MDLLEVDGKQIPMYGYMSYQPEKACYGDFRKAGVHLFFPCVYAGDRGINQNSGIRPFCPGFWKGYGQYDFSAAEKTFELILKHCIPGEDYLIPRLMLEPPAWWDRINPDELCRDAQGTPMHHSACSEKWKKDTEEIIIAFQRWIEEKGYDQFVAGWHVACGNTEEYLRPSLHPMQLMDYSLRAQEGFRAWSMKKYAHQLEKLNEAWRTNYKSWDEISIPSPAKRLFGVGEIFRSREYEMQTIDYYAFQNQMNAQMLIDLCKMAKRATKNQQVIGGFYGYTTCALEQGHHAMEMVLHCDAVDFLASPLQYMDRRAQGVDWPFPGVVASAQLHKKPWFIEADVRTMLSRPLSQCMPHADPVVARYYDAPVWLGPDTAEGSLGQMKKVLGKALCHNTAIWWFDMWGGWHDHPELMEFHQKAAQIYREYALSGGAKTNAPVALFLDEELYQAVIPEIARPAPVGSQTSGSQLTKNLGFMGTGYHMYLFSDLKHVNPDDYRMALLIAPSHWDEERIAALENWKKKDRLIAFAGKGQEKCPNTIAFDENGFPVAQKSDVIISEDENGNALEILRRYSDYSLYACRNMTLEPDRLRQLVCAAGGQVYNSTGEVIDASHRFISIHAASDGVKRICIPKKAQLREAFTGKILPGNECFIDVEMKFGETLLLEIVPIDEK